MAECVQEEIQFFQVKQYRDMWLSRFCRPASVRDYENWLWAFMRKGGQPTHYYDYDVPSEFFVALGDFKTNPLYGSLAVNVIVPRQFNHTGGELGHCNIYLMRDLVHLGSWIPVYHNMTVPDDLEARVTAFIREQEERRRKAEHEHFERNGSLLDSWRTFVQSEGVEQA